jgi:hypothetical protein
VGGVNETAKRCEPGAQSHGTHEVSRASELEGNLIMRINILIGAALVAGVLAAP